MELYLLLGIGIGLALGVLGTVLYYDVTSDAEEPMTLEDCEGMYNQGYAVVCEDGNAVRTEKEKAAKLSD